MAKKTRPGFRLSKPSDCRRILAKTANRFDQGEIDEGHARTLGYLINLCLKAMEFDSLSLQMDRIEEKLGGGQ